MNCLCQIFLILYNLMSKFVIKEVREIDYALLSAARDLSSLLTSSNQVTLTKSYLELMVANPCNYWLVAQETTTRKYLGMASLVIMHMPTNVRASLENVAVLPSEAGKGIGTALCFEAKRIADENEVNTLRAAALKNNTASLRMLEKAGFVVEDSMDYLECSISRGPRF